MDAYNCNYIHPQYDYHQLQSKIHREKYSKKMHFNPANLNTTSEPCRVCGFNQNTGRNFGVISCSTCKAFFRRNGRHSSSIPSCRFGGHCTINERTRRQCPSCRLAKCFAVGMQKDLIRTDEERAARLQLVRANRLQRYERAHQQLSEENQQYHSHRPLLSSNDWLQINNIQNTYQQYCLYPILRAEEEHEEYLNTLPLKCRLKENSFLNVLKIRLTALSTFFRMTLPVFAVDMNKLEQKWLIQANLRYLLIFSSMDLMNTNGNQLHFDEHKICHNIYLYVYGQALINRENNLIHRLNRSIASDSFISKLMQIILFLSPCLVTNYVLRWNSSIPNLKTILNILHSKEHFTEMLWSYLIHKYGEMSAQKLFLNVIGQVLQHQIYGSDIDQSLIERQPFGNLVYSLWTTFSLD